MEEVKILELTEQCVKFFQDHCYTESRISKYKGLWRTGIIRYMAQNDIEYYSPSVGAGFVSTCHFNSTIRPQERERIRSIQVLDDMMELGYIRKRCITPVYHALDGEIGMEMEKLVAHLAKLRRSKSTIGIYRLHLSEFLAHLESRGTEHVTDIRESDILTFVSAHPSDKVNIVSTLRVLFRFWKEEHVVDSRFDELFDTYKVHRKERIPSFFTAEEVMRIEQSITRSSGVGKRSPSYYIVKSKSVSTNLGIVVEAMFGRLPEGTPPEVLYNRCDALLRLQRNTEPRLFELACENAIRFERYSYKFIDHAIKSKCLGILDACRSDELDAPPEHENIRGVFC